MKRVLIIGAGMAGLSAGIHAQANGYDTEIFEMHTIPGGLCTSWKRGSYLIDGCIHWLCGSSGKGLLGKFLDEVGILKGRAFFNHEELTRIETGLDNDRRMFIAYTDHTRLNRHLKELSPEDAGEIDRFTALIEKFIDFPVGTDKPQELWKVGDYVSFMKNIKPFMKEFRVYGSLTVGEYANRFASVHIREGLESILDMPDFSFFALLMMLGWHSSGNAGYPLGGSLPVAKVMEERYLGMGGRIRYGARVEKIIVEKKRAAGIRLADGTEYRGDQIISCADGASTIYRMLDGKYTSRKLDRYYRELPLFNSLFCLSLGINRDLRSEPGISVRCLATPIVLEGTEYRKIGIKHYCQDPAMAPEGKSLVEIMYPSDYDYWKNLSADRKSYDNEKKRIAATLIDALEQIHPGISKDIEMTDTATPVTWERYTGNRRGTFEGWFINPDTMKIIMPKTLPGLKNFWMAGQWVQPGGGIVTCIKSGRDIVYRLCAADRKPFNAPADSVNRV